MRSLPACKEKARHFGTPHILHKTNPSPRPPQKLYRSSYVSLGQLVPPTLPRPVFWLICAKNNIKHQPSTNQPTNLGFIGKAGIRLPTLDEGGLLFAKSRQGHFHGLDGLLPKQVHDKHSEPHQWPFPYSSGNTCKEK